MATTKIILKEKIDKIGAEADIVQVRSGYARNFLIPTGKAYEATKKNLHHIETLKQIKQVREAKELETAHQLSSKIQRLKLDFILQTGEKGKAFGSITNMMIYKELKEKGIEIDRHKIQLDSPIKNNGRFDVPIAIHPEVSTTLKVNVQAKKPEKDENEEGKLEDNKKEKTEDKD